MKTEILNLIENFSSFFKFLSSMKGLKLAMNDDILMISLHEDKTYIYYRISERLIQSNLSFEMTYNKYFY